MEAQSKTVWARAAPKARVGKGSANDRANEWLTVVFVEHRLILPGSAENIHKDHN